MRLLFKKTCPCPIDQNDLPKPSLHVLEGFDTDDEEPSLKLTVDIICPKCETPWESFAGLLAEPKRPRLVVTPDEVDDSNVRMRDSIRRRTLP
jgi:hypothetical protein